MVVVSSLFDSLVCLVVMSLHDKPCCAMLPISLASTCCTWVSLFDDGFYSFSAVHMIVLHRATKEESQLETPASDVET